MRFPPANVVLSWPPPNYIDPIERGPALMIVELTSLSIALLCLCLRLYVRFFIIRKSWWDDWLMVAATVSIAGQTLFLFASGLSKLSILTSYLRIAPLGSSFRRLTWMAMFVIFALLWIFLIVLWTQCLPAWHYWDLLVDNRNCLDEWPPLAGQTITTVATDFLVYILPIPTLFRLRLPATQRVVLLLLFSLGTVVVVAGVMRTYWVHYVEEETYDVTWEGFDLWIWTALEANLAVVCGCVPVLRRLLPSTSDSKPSTLMDVSAPPTIGSGKKKKGKRHDSDHDIERHAMGLINAPSFTDGDSINMPPPTSSPGWSPILDSWARRQHQQHCRHGR
ncbi:integral membrane protein [Colletotrichum incanum]|nr:integral membrane protein [Colletotrichum incanum]